MWVGHSGKKRDNSWDSSMDSREGIRGSPFRPPEGVDAGRGEWFSSEVPRGSREIGFMA